MFALVSVLASLVGGPQAAIRVDTVKVPLADGTQLHTLIFRPDDGNRHAAVLVRTPYGAAAQAKLANHLLPLGIALVSQDVRGQGQSTGQFIPFVAEQKDGLATVNWITGQPWSDGRIGLWGISYLGYAAYAIAETGHPAVRAMVTINAWADLGAFVTPGGALQLGLALPWMATFAKGGRPPADPFAPDFRTLPLSAAMPGMDRVIGFAKQPFDWGKVAIPLLQIAGWNDYTLDADLLTYERLRTQHPKTARALVIGPWAHNGLMSRSRTVGSDSLPPSAIFSDSASIFAADWFRVHLLGQGAWRRAPVTLWMQGANRWTTPASWRPEGKGTRWYLAGKAANGSDGGGLLALRPEAAAIDTFTSDPALPVPTIAGATPQFFPQWIGPRDRRPVQSRRDVLVYTAPISRVPLEIVGRPEAILAIESEALTFDVSVTLSAVMPDGQVRHLTDGYLRVATAVRGTEIRVPLTPTAITLPAGSAFRVEVSGSNFPRFDRNPGTGEDPLTATTLRPVMLTLRKGGQSMIVIP
ncbi:MAG: CocE/NonD family hydrolase [Gemmatimonadales bacterium]|nr:CocE/NonD family hydrolase [Gemmatimonadales bacterium]